MRDRVVILGRRKSGKTIFLARLYHHLFQTPGPLRLHALSGPAHLRMVEIVAELEKGRWPAATGQASAMEFEVWLDGRTERVVALDYPGEVFRRAFMEEAEGPDVDELLRHVDRAAAVILLIDPALAVRGEASESAEDDYGMVQALRRIRASPGGERVPVSLVLTKLDANRATVEDAGGLRPFVERHYGVVLRATPEAHLFACAAVSTRADPLGHRVPDPATPPVGVAEPLLSCLRRLALLRRDEALQLQAREGAAADLRQRAVAELEARGERRVLWVVWVLAALVIVTAAVVTLVALEWSRPG